MNDSTGIHAGTGSSPLSTVVAILAFCFALSLLPAAHAQETFFADGHTDWKIYLSPAADPTERYAAEELRNALRKLSGAEFEVLAEAEVPATHAIVIGDLNHPEVRAQAAALELTPGKVEQVAVHTLDGRLYLAGNQPRGALYAVYRFLQHELGVRWLWPGPDGEFIPAKDTWSLPDLHVTYTPPIPYRGFHLCGNYYGSAESELFREWMGRNFVNIYRHAAPLAEKRRGFYSMWSSHNAGLPAALFQQHPEYFAEVDGKRYAENICFSHPEVDRLVAESLAEYVRKHPQLDILSVFPKDTTTYCRCERCAKLDPSTAWYEFYNRLTDALKAEFPELRFGAIAYFEYRAVPQCEIRNTEFVEYCSYSRCNIHPYGHPDCAPNDHTMRELLAWQATGLPIGNYGYEFDIFRRNHRFAPFLSVIDDAIKTARKLGHVTMIPEVLLIARKHVEAEEYVFNVQQRLPIYLYARLLWNPDQEMTDVLRDWCRTVYGEAAEPMLGYYLSMDRAWSAMPVHTSILGDALNVAPHLLTDSLRKEANAAFAMAEQRLPTIADAVARERAAAAIVRERTLYRQWQELARASDVTTPRLSLPLLAQAEDFVRSASRPRNVGTAQVRLAWTREALLVRWVCPEATADKRVELVLSSGLTGETWHFTVSPLGTQQAWRETATGVRDDRWNPVWQATITTLGDDRWQTEMTLPFASLGQAPNPKESWQARFVRHPGRQAEVAPATFPEDGMALIVFTDAARADRALLWWSGAPEREGKFDAALTQEFTQAGWQLHLVTTPEGLSALDGTCDVYWFKHPNGPNKPPAEFWEQRLVPAVKDGAVAVFASYWDMPLDQYFQDLSMKVTTASIAKLPLAARRTSFIAPGEWSSSPHTLLPALKSGITPAYVLVPAEAATWTILATAPQNETESMPYLMVRAFGKGLIVVCTGPIARVANAALLDNLLLYREKLTIANPEEKP